MVSVKTEILQSSVKNFSGTFQLLVLFLGTGIRLMDFRRDCPIKWENKNRHFFGVLMFVCSIETIRVRLFFFPS